MKTINKTQYNAIQKAVRVLGLLSDDQYDALVDDGCTPDTARFLLEEICAHASHMNQ